MKCYEHCAYLVALCFDDYCCYFKIDLSNITEKIFPCHNNSYGFVKRSFTYHM